MGEVIHTSHIHISREESAIRTATIEDLPGKVGEVRYGIHGGIKRFYKAEPKEELPATLDHMISAIGG